MKKIFSFMLLLLCAVATSWAQETTVEIAPTTGSYTRSSGTWASEWTSNYEPKIKLASHNTSYDGVNNMTTVDSKIELWSGQTLSSFYTLKVAAGYVIKGYSFNYVGKNAAGNRNVEIVAGSQTATSTSEEQTFTVTGLNSRSTVIKLNGVVSGSATNKNNGIIITDFQVNIAPAAEVESTYALGGRLKISDAPEAGVWADNTTWYLIQIKENGAYISTANVNTDGYLQANVTERPNNCDERALWCVVGNETTGYKFYNKAEGTAKVLYGSRVLNSGYPSFKMQDDQDVENVYFDLKKSTAPVSGTDSRELYVAVKDHGSDNNYLNNRTNLAYWNSSNATTANGTGSALAFLSPEDAEVSLAEAKSLLDESGFAVNPGEEIVALQADDVNAPGYIKCNNPETTEGDIHQLFDGKVEHNNFFHSNWYGGGETPHRLDVDLGEGNSLSNFVIEYSTRINNGGSLADFPDAIEILGSNDGSTYTSIKTFNSGMPQGQGLTWVAPSIVKATEGYRYLRFIIRAERTFWHMSEFKIYTNPSYTITNGDENLIDIYGNINEIQDINIETLSALDLLSAENIIKSNTRVLGTSSTIEDGEFYYIRSAVKENGYVYSKLSDEHVDDEADAGTIGFNALAWVSTTTASNQGTWKCEIIEGVAYLKNVHTASYISALHTYKAGVLSETEKAPIVLEALGQGQVRVKVNGSQLHAQNNGYAVPWGDGVNTPSAWYIEKASGVQPHTLTVGPAGYATLMLGYNTTIPTIEGEDCGVFAATVEGDWAVMNEIEGVLPANTAVIVKAAPGDYTFEYTTNTATVENNDLRGTLYNKNMTEDAYVLGIVDDKVGLYKAEMNQNDGAAWLNNANKAYLPVPANAEGVKSYSFRFNFGGTTGVEEVEVENDVKVIYDLTGRRVNEITEKGIYIVNGNKVLVK